MFAPYRSEYTSLTSSALDYGPPHGQAWSTLPLGIRMLHRVLRLPDRLAGGFAHDVRVQPRQGPPGPRILRIHQPLDQTPLRAIGLVTFISILPGLLDFASSIAVNAIFAMTAMALDFSYIIPIFW